MGIASGNEMTVGGNFSVRIARLGLEASHYRVRNQSIALDFYTAPLDKTS
jgi:hypothetical protein